MSRKPKWMDEIDERQQAMLTEARAPRSRDELAAMQREIVEARAKTAERQVMREREAVAEFCDDVIALAERQTGLSRSALLEEAAKLPPHPTEVRASPRWLMRAGRVPDKYIDDVADHPTECAALATVRRFLDDRAVNLLVLTGGVGVMKTGSACWAIGEMGGEFADATELLTYKFEHKDRWWRILNAPLVVLDDVGYEAAGEHQLSAISSLFNNAYSSGRRLIATTNLPLDGEKGFKQRYGKRVHDRLVECGQWKPIAGESVRRNLRAAKRVRD